MKGYKMKFFDIILTITIIILYTVIRKNILINVPFFELVLIGIAIGYLTSTITEIIQYLKK